MISKDLSKRAHAAVGSAAILAAVSGILPETLLVHGLVFEIGVLPRRGFGKMPNPAAKTPTLRALMKP